MPQASRRAAKRASGECLACPNRTPARLCRLCRLRDLRRKRDAYLAKLCEGLCVAAGCYNRTGGAYCPDCNEAQRSRRLAKKSPSPPPR